MAVRRAGPGAASPALARSPSRGNPASPVGLPGLDSPARRPAPARAGRTGRGARVGRAAQAQAARAVAVARRAATRPAAQDGHAPAHLRAVEGGHAPMPQLAARAAREAAHLRPVDGREAVLRGPEAGQRARRAAEGGREAMPLRAVPDGRAVAHPRAVPDGRAVAHPRAVPDGRAVAHLRVAQDAHEVAQPRVARVAQAVAPRAARGAAVGPVVTAAVRTVEAVPGREPTAGRPALVTKRARGHAATGASPRPDRGAARAAATRTVAGTGRGARRGPTAREAGDGPSRRRLVVPARADRDLATRRPMAGGPNSRPPSRPTSWTLRHGRS
jgi:hypothetical protein